LENVISSRHIEHSETEPLGKVTLFNAFMTTKSRAGTEEEVAQLTSEKERIHTLQDKFGLGDLPPEAESNIRKQGLALA
jgi:arylamine N-acetyltransferase